jgi:hypothetical protein
VRQLIHKQNVGPPADRRFHIKLVERSALVLNLHTRQNVEPQQHLLCLGTPVRLDHAGDDIHALPRQPLPSREHGVGLADPGGHAEEDLEASSSLSGSDHGRTVNAGSLIAFEAIQHLIGVVGAWRGVRKGHRWSTVLGQTFL